MTIAGFDPSAAAGLLADLRVFAREGVYATAVITAVTAQNTRGVQDIMSIPAAMVARQFDSVADDITVHAAKAGMLYNRETIEVTARKMEEYALPNFVLDPVAISSSGTWLIEEKSLEVLRDLLLPRAKIVTPNKAETEMLAEMTVDSVRDMKRAAEKIHRMGCEFVLIKGGHLSGDAVDIVFDGEEYVEYRSGRIKGADVRGTGCAFSAAIAAALAKGSPPHDAIARAKSYIQEAIRGASEIGRGAAVLF